MVSAASKVPPTKARLGISRVDVYVSGRPVLSIDAEAGLVPPTQVPVVREGSAHTPVEAQAWDHTGKLVAIRRTTLR